MEPKYFSIQNVFVSYLELVEVLGVVLGLDALAVEAASLEGLARAAGGPRVREFDEDVALSGAPATTGIGHRHLHRADIEKGKKP